MCSRLVPALILLIVIPRPAVSQMRAGEGGTLTPIRRSWEALIGRRLRITSLDPGVPSPDTLVGVLVGVEGDGLWLRDAGETRARLVTAGPSTKVEEWRTLDPSAGYMVAGALLGGVAGGVTVAWLRGERRPYRCEGTFDDVVSAALACSIGNVFHEVGEDVGRAADLAAGILVGSSLGILIGRAIGMSRITEGWVAVRLKRLRVRRGRRHGMELAFGIAR